MGTEFLYEVSYKSKYDCLKLTTNVINTSTPVNGNIYENNKLVKKNTQVANLEANDEDLRFVT